MKKHNKNTKRPNLQKITLLAIGAAGILTAALFVPNALKLLETFGFTSRKKQKDSIQAARKRLITKGLIQYRDGGFQLTDAGERAVRKFEIEGLRVEKRKKWDKKWRVVMFDIPEKKRLIRDKVRLFLSEIGFLRLQDSVWLYPYDCEEIISLIKIDFHVGKDIVYLVADSIENDGLYKKAFNLI